jgi:membrane protein
MGSETMQVSQILIKSTESKSTIWSMIGVIILLVGSTALWSYKIIKLNLARGSSSKKEYSLS